MLIWLSFLLPILSTIIILIFWHQKISWKEIVLKLVVCLIVVICAKSCSTAFITDDVEYWSYRATELWHEDPWDEWIEETCTERYPCGTDSKGNTTYCTRTYDCSYRKYHDEEFYFKDQYDIKHYIGKTEYLKYLKLWKNESFVDMHRNYYHLDGNAQKSIWKGERHTLKIFVDKHTYENKVKASKNVFNYEKIDTFQQRKFGLLDYPEYTYSSVLSRYSWPWKDSLIQDVNYTNAMLGPTKQVKIWYLIFRNSPSIIGRKQEAFWQGGNKNEFVICLSLDKLNKVEWCHVFSWTDNKKPVVEIQHFIAEQTKFNWSKTNLKVEEVIKNEFVRKQFKDFSYLKIEPTKEAIIWSYIIMLFFSVCFSIFIIREDLF